MTILVLSTCAFCIIATVLHLASIATVLQRVRRSAAEVNGGESLEGISIIRPVCGVENFSEETLLSGFHLDYPRYELLFCVAQASDPVVPLVRRLIELHPHVPARLLVGNECISANPKLNNVVKGWAAASYPWIVMADSNVLMPPDYLHRLLETWRPDTAFAAFGLRSRGSNRGSAYRGSNLALPLRHCRVGPYVAVRRGLESAQTVLNN